MAASSRSSLEDLRTKRACVAALGLIAAAQLGCQRGEAPSPAAAAAEAVRPEDPKTAEAAQRLDQLGVALEALVARAESAAADPAQLQPLQRELEALTLKARADLGGVEKAMTQDQRRAVQAYYAQRIAPVHARLQVLLFPVLLIDLPRGATPQQPLAPGPAATPSAAESTKGKS